MSYLLATTIRQIRFPVIDGPFGTYTLVINRPGYTALTQPAANTLLLSRVTDAANPIRVTPYFESDIPLSKKITTTKGRRALDDVTIAIRDTLGYSGTVNGVATSEQFDSTYQTFFNVWFNDPLQYPAWVLAVDLNSNADVPTHGYIDPAYKPSADPIIVNFGTAQQIWIGTRSIKIVAQKQSVTWKDVLTQIHPVDCAEGPAYHGFMRVVPGLEGQSNTRHAIFGPYPGEWMQAVPYFYRPELSNPQLVRGIGVVWPTNPWNLIPATNAIASADIEFIGTGVYNFGDVLTIVQGGVGTNATAQIVGSSSDVRLQILTGGSGFASDTVYNTTGGGGSGLTVRVHRIAEIGTWGPSGFAFIQVGRLFQMFESALGCSGFNPSTDLKSALDWFCQKADNTNKNFPVNATPIALTNLWVSLNVIAKAHPFDGSFWDNPIGFSPDTPLLDCLSAFCNLLLSDFNTVNALDGTSALNLRKMGDVTTTLPAPNFVQGTWVGVAVPSEEEPTTGPLAAQVKNKADDLTIQSPVGAQFADGALSIEIPFRIHRIGITSGQMLSPDLEACTWDSKKKPEEQARACFEIAFRNNDGTYVANPDCWKSLCHLYLRDAAGTAAVYPSTWSPFPNNDGSAGSWANSFYAVNAVYKSGDTPPVNLQGVFKGNDYFNTRAYHAVAFAGCNLSLPIIQSYQFSGVCDSGGSVQNINAGMAASWGYEGNAQSWRGIEVTQLLHAGGTQIKFQAQRFANGFPNLTDLTYGSVGGAGTSSTTGGGTNTGGSVTTNSGLNFSTLTKTLTANTDDWIIGQAGPTIVLISAAANYTLSGITGGKAGDWLILKNISSNFISLVNGAGSLAVNQIKYTGSQIALGKLHGVAGLWHNGSNWEVLWVH